MMLCRWHLARLSAVLPPTRQRAAQPIERRVIYIFCESVPGLYPACLQLEAQMIACMLAGSAQHHMRPPQHLFARGASKLGTAAGGCSLHDIRYMCCFHICCVIGRRMQEQRLSPRRGKSH